MNKTNLAIGLALVAMIIALGAYSYPKQAAQIAQELGSVGSRFPNGLAVGTTASVTQNKLTIGNSGTALGNVGFATCNLIGSDGSLAASSSKAYDCAVTGVTSSSLVFAQLASTTVATSTGAGWFIQAAAASSTSDYVTVILTNYTGSAAKPSVTSVGSSTQIWFVR